MATLKEVAIRANVSTATVSKVLSQTPYVSPKTQARVLQAIEELGYVPNLAARALSKGRTYIIGVLFPYNYDHLFADPLVMNILEGIEAVCIEQGYNMLLSTPRIPLTESVQFQHLIRSKYFDGLVALDVLPGSLISQTLTEHDCLYVSIGGSPEALNSVYVDDFAGTEAIAEYLIELGHRHIGIIALAPEVLDSAERRMAGYRSAFAKAKLDSAALPVAYGNFSVESGYQAADYLLGCTPRPTAILCMNDRMAIGAIQRLHAGGLRVPEDVSICGFDDIPAAAYSNPPLTTVHQPAQQMGQRAAQMLLELVESHKRHKEEPLTGFSPVVFPVELIIRHSATQVRG